ncbi:MAG: tRNA lysidine(34) synthetase TilS [Flavobacteriales bacterium]|nr:tRNA lysidine(34) synthetase TilS [Flavobacteriales bacterium]MCB9449092.1 tRNA lysidine(34) synthetase TilS [Flavobacteriales bacterium]
MYRSFRQYIKQHHLVETASTVLLAVSGGVDSVVMAALFHRAQIPFAMAHVNFKLRGKESEEDARFVKQLARKFKVPFHYKEIPLKGKQASGASVQMLAREKRYAWFEGLLVDNGYAHVATAHHLDDQVETVLINMVRGTGLAGLRGMLPQQGARIHPLLFATREEIRSYAASQKLSYREDSSNASRKYTRNRMRLDVVPVLRQINPSLEKTMEANVARWADAEAIVNSALVMFRDEILEDKGTHLEIPRWCLSPQPGLQLLLSEVLKDYGFHEDVAASILQETGKTGKEFFSGTHRLTVGSSVIYIRKRSPKKKDDTPPSWKWNLSKATLRINRGIFTRKILNKPPAKWPKDPAIACLDADTCGQVLTVRYWKKGDTFRPLGLKGSKKLSDFFTDIKMDRAAREEVPLILSGNKVVWIAGCRVDERFKVKPGTKRVLQLSWKMDL